MAGPITLFQSRLKTTSTLHLLFSRAPFMGNGVPENQTAPNEQDELGKSQVLQLCWYYEHTDDPDMQTQKYTVQSLSPSIQSILYHLLIPQAHNPAISGVPLRRVNMEQPWHHLTPSPDYLRSSRIRYSIQGDLPQMLTGIKFVNSNHLARFLGLVTLPATHATAPHDLIIVVNCSRNVTSYQRCCKTQEV